MRASDILPRPHRPPVRGVLLDGFRTLFSPDNLSAVFTVQGLDPTLVPCWLARLYSDGIALAAAQDYRRFEEVAASALAVIAPDADAQAVQGVLEALPALDPYPDVEEGLVRLRNSGVRILTLCAVDRWICHAWFARAGLEALVDGFLSAEPVRRWKPAPEAYTYGAAQVGWPPAQVAFISAHDWDVHGARRAGMQTGQIVRPGLSSASIFDGADAVGPDLLTVVDALLSRK